VGARVGVEPVGGDWVVGARVGGEPVGGDGVVGVRVGGEPVGGDGVGARDGGEPVGGVGFGPPPQRAGGVEEWSHHLVDPCFSGRNTRVDSRKKRVCAIKSPGHNANLSWDTIYELEKRPA
jgi:hypothetical protein